MGARASIDQAIQTVTELTYRGSDLAKHVAIADVLNVLELVRCLGELKFGKQKGAYRRNFSW